MPLVPDAFISIDSVTMSCVVCPWCEDAAVAQEFAKRHCLSVRLDRCPECAEKFKRDPKPYPVNSKEPFKP